MKLQKLPVPDKTIRPSWRIKKGTMDIFDAYQSYYKTVYGIEISASDLADEILRVFFREDKAFQKYLSKRSAGDNSQDPKSPA